MTSRFSLRDLSLFVLAAAFGWWAHSLNATVHADSRNNSSDIAFQFGGAGVPGSLTLFNPESRTLYIYPVTSGSSHINCSYSVHVGRVGDPIDRANCPAGEFTSH